MGIIGFESHNSSTGQSRQLIEATGNQTGAIESVYSVQTGGLSRATNRIDRCGAGWGPRD